VRKFSTLTNELNCILSLDTVVGKQLHEFCLELCSLCFRILQYGICFLNLIHWQMEKTVSKGRKGGKLCMVPHQSGLLLVQKEFPKGKNYNLSRILSFKFDYIYKWHVCFNFTFVLGLNYVACMDSLGIKQQNEN